MFLFTTHRNVVIPQGLNQIGKYNQEAMESVFGVSSWFHLMPYVQP